MSIIVVGSRLYDALYAGIYSTPCRFANIERFVDVIGSTIDLQQKMGIDAARSAFRDAASVLRPNGPIEDNQAAARLLVAEDLCALAESELSDLDTPPAEKIIRSGGAIKARLRDAGLNVLDFDLRIVDEFPAPFDQFGWSAFAPDREDEERYGIDPGVYFRRDRLRPFYSEALYAHEVIHTVPGRVDPTIYAMGLEEGLAEILGTCFAAAAVLPSQVLRNILVYGRHGVQRPKLWSLYRDHTRQAFLLYREFGLDGLVALLAGGRERIHDAERAILCGTHQSLDLPRGGWDDDTTRLLDSFCCGYLPSHVFTPLEVVLVDHVAEGVSLPEICARANVPEAIGLPLLRRLGGDSALFVNAADTVAYSNVAHYLAIGAAAQLPIIRYLLPENREE